MHVNLNRFFQENTNQLIILDFEYILTSTQTQGKKI
jgi:hypothetical protein